MLIVGTEVSGSGYAASEFFLDLFQTVGADALAVEVYDVVRVVAEDAGGVVLRKYYTVVVGEDLKRIFLLDIHRFAQLDRKHYASELVYHSYNSG